jgi:hypothetical protein
MTITLPVLAPVVAPETPPEPGWWWPELPAVAPRRTLDDLLLQLAELGSADAIAQFFLDNGVRGERGDSSRCPVKQWVSAETGQEYLVSTQWVYRAEVLGGCILPSKDARVRARACGLPHPVQEFVRKFDAGEYPALAVARRLGDGCGCIVCHGGETQ